MRIVEESWNVLVTLLPTGWQQMAWRSGAVQRLRGFPSPDVLRVLMLHVARGYSLRETVVRAKLANWTDISDIALLKRLQNSEEWLRWLCIELLRENGGYRLEKGMSRTIRIVDGTIVRESNVTPHVAQNLERPGGSAIDARTTQQVGYAIRQRKRKRIEECFGWLKTIALLRKVRHRGLFKVEWNFTFAAAAYNLIRMRNLAIQTT
jgi:hypothetical protein